MDFHSPSYYIRKRLLANTPAMVGLGIILSALIVAILGYIIMPDSTPNANDGAVQIQKFMPGSSTLLIKKKRQIEVGRTSWIEYILFGQESEYTILPVKSYELDSFQVHFIPDGRIQIQESLPLIEIITSASHTVNADGVMEENYTYAGNEVILKQNGQRYTIQELHKIFEEDHIEKRTFLLGTDKSGRDLLSRLIFGTRISLGIGLVAVFISLIFGISIGSIAGFFGGKIDGFMLWIMTVVWSIPSIMLVIAISLALQSKGIWVAFVAVGLTSWVEIARVVRGQIISIKEKTYIEAARALGINNYQIIWKHILPNLVGPIIVIATSNFASAILTEAGLSFLGLGVQPPMPSWGMMVNEGFHSIGTMNSWHLILFPSLSISILVLSFNLFGSGLRDAYDPQKAMKW